MTVFLSLLFLVVLAQLCSTELSDVTTVYRFDDEDLDGSRYSKRQEYSGEDVTWHFMGSTGWTKTNNAKVGVPLPNEEDWVFELGSNSMTDILPLDVKNTFTVSMNSTSSPFIYLLSDKNPDIADLLVFEQRSSYVYVRSCEGITGGQDFIILGLRKRNCRLVMSWYLENFPSIFDFITLYFHLQEYSIDVTSSTGLIDIIRNDSLQYFRNMKYISMGASQTPTKFIFKNSKQVWALKESTGELSFYRHQFQGTTCLILNYFLDTHSGGRLELHYKNRVLQTKSANQQKASWITHRFVLKEGFYWDDVRIIAHKNSNAPVLIESIRVCGDRETWNYTTFEYPGSVDTHARTNALGRPFLMPNGSLAGPNVDVNIPGCPDVNRNCAWDVDNWEHSNVNDEIMQSAPLPLWNEITEVWATFENGLTKYYPISSSVKLTFFLQNWRDSSAQVRVFLTEYEEWENGIMIRINRNGINVYDIPNSYTGQTCWISEGLNVYCYEISTLVSGSISLKEGVEYELLVEHIPDQLRVVLRSVGNEMSCLVPLTETTDKRMNFIAMTTSYVSASGLLTSSVNYMLELSSSSGKLTSPVIIPTSSDICVSLIYYISSGGHANLWMETPDGNRTNLEKLSDTQGWEHKRIVKSHGQSHRLRLILEGFRPDDGVVLVQRIGGCHPEEDVINLGHEEYLQVMKSEAVDKKETTDSFWLERRKSHIMTDVCVNGGLPDDQGGCICPPGFIGQTCEQGCGPDRYGGDCGGRCSLSKRGCKAMYLCKPSWGCSCAPGYTGTFCSRSCSPGSYGAGCEQKCGHGIGARSDEWGRMVTECNVYTGHCPNGCARDFIPPLCQERYSYFAAPPEVIRTGDKLTVRLDFRKSNIKGKGTPLYFQMQYKRNEHSSWAVFHSGHYENTSETAHITVGEPVTDSSYHIRAVIINRDGGSNQGDELPSALVKKTCTVLQPSQYELKASEIEEESFDLSWQLPTDDTEWCKISHVEVFLKEGWRWSQLANTTLSQVKITGRSPGEHYSVRVRAMTTPKENVPFSDTIKVTTSGVSPFTVQKLRVTSSGSTQLILQWEYPQLPSTPDAHYLVTFQCQKLLGCQHESCTHSGGRYRSYDNTALLANLLPHAQYSISVAVFSSVEGPAAYLRAVTLPSGSQAIAGSVDEPLSDCTNTTFTVHWAPPDNCSKINGFFQGYWYQLKEEGQERVLLEGDTVQPLAKFTKLTPRSSYRVEVFVMTDGGWDKNHPLVILAKTRATTPEQVRNLTLYKASRRMVGLRWEEPAETYGALESFKVSYAEAAVPKKTVSLEVNLTRCTAWSDLYCATISKLRPDTEYTFTVQARNEEVPEDGEPASVKAKTQEGPPEPPSYIQLNSRGPTSLSVQWGIPNLLNGILRSFLVSVEEVDSYNSSDCCQYFPVQEVAVHHEETAYHVEVSGLRPASIYSIGIQGKTTAFGGAISMTSHTTPPAPELPREPQVILDKDTHRTKVLLSPVTEYQELVKGYLLLRVSDDDTNDAVIWDQGLAAQIRHAVNETFSIIGEYSQEELMSDEPIIIPNREISSEEGILGEVSAPSIPNDTRYRLLLVVVLEYEGTYNISYKQSAAVSYGDLL